MNCINRFGHGSGAVVEGSSGIVDDSFLAIWLHNKKPLQRPPLAFTKTSIHLPPRPKGGTEVLFLFGRSSCIDTVSEAGRARSLNPLHRCDRRLPQPILGGQGFLCWNGPKSHWLPIYQQ